MEIAVAKYILAKRKASGFLRGRTDPCAAAGSGKRWGGERGRGYHVGLDLEGRGRVWCSGIFEQWGLWFCVISHFRGWGFGCVPWKLTPSDGSGDLTRGRVSFDVDTLNGTGRRSLLG